MLVLLFWCNVVKLQCCNIVFFFLCCNHEIRMLQCSHVVCYIVVMWFFLHPVNFMSRMFDQVLNQKTLHTNNHGHRDRHQPPDILHSNRLAPFASNIMVKFNEPNGPAYFHHSRKNVACDNVASTVVKKILFLDEDNCCSFLLFSFDYIY